MRCDQQRCLVCGEVGHFLDFVAAGLCALCAPSEVVASIDLLEAPAPQLIDFHLVPEHLEVTELMPAVNLWLDQRASA